MINKDIIVDDLIDKFETILDNNNLYKGTFIKKYIDKDLNISLYNIWYNDCLLEIQFDDDDNNIHFTKAVFFKNDVKIDDNYVCKGRDDLHIVLYKLQNDYCDIDVEKEGLWFYGLV